ncbi:MAG TPA: hypothetical protein VGJ77_03670 [Gaiellaceae bacterium]|jgi:lysophospholipase L1-like esterase
MSYLATRPERPVAARDVRRAGVAAAAFVALVAALLVFVAPAGAETVPLPLPEGPSLTTSPTPALTDLTLQPAPVPPGCWTWAMPRRYDADPDRDGLFDEHVTAAFVNPSSWSLILIDNCFPDSTPLGAVERRWTVSTPIPTVVVTRSSRVTTSVPRLGTYTIHFEHRFVTAAGASAWVDDGTVDATMRDFLIVSLGDSIAAGEGNPDRAATASSGPVWQSPVCRRSRNSGHALAAQSLEDRSTQSSVTFVHVACSGATITQGILGSYQGADPAAGPTQAPQASQALTLLDRNLDGKPDRAASAVLVQVGANDIKFRDMVLKCVFLGQTSAQIWNDFAQGWNDVLAGISPVATFLAGLPHILECNDPTASLSLADAAVVSSFVNSGCLRFFRDPDDGIGFTEQACNFLAGLYDMMPSTIDSSAGQFAALAPRITNGYAAMRSSVDLLAGFHADRVIVTGYQNVANNLDGNPCDPLLGWLDPANWNLAYIDHVLPFVSGNEYAWASGRLIPALNTRVENAAVANEWQFVQNSQSFVRGGYCAPDGARMVRGFFESLRVQGNPFGILHPNARGNRAMANNLIPVIGATVGA